MTNRREFITLRRRGDEFALRVRAQRKRLLRT
jgi:hypothetical protein